MSALKPRWFWVFIERDNAGQEFVIDATESLAASNLEPADLSDPFTDLLIVRVQSVGPIDLSGSVSVRNGEKLSLPSQLPDGRPIPAMMWSEFDEWLGETESDVVWL